MTLPASKIGYKGQRYTICVRMNGVYRELGWCETNPIEYAKEFEACLGIDRVNVVDGKHPELMRNPIKAIIYRQEA